MARSIVKTDQLQPWSWDAEIDGNPEPAENETVPDEGQHQSEEILRE